MHHSVPQTSEINAWFVISALVKLEISVMEVMGMSMEIDEIAMYICELTFKRDDHRIGCWHYIGTFIGYRRR